MYCFDKGLTAYLSPKYKIDPLLCCTSIVRSSKSNLPNFYLQEYLLFIMSINMSIIGILNSQLITTGLSQHTVQGNFELYSISLNFIYKIMVQMSFYCVYILPQSYARVQFPKFLRFLWEIKAASAKKVRKTGQPFSQQPVHQHFLVLKEHQNVWNFLGW